MTQTRCLHHGLLPEQHPEGFCLYCCLCFKTLLREECAFLPDGSRVDLCVPCMEEEHRQVVSAARKRGEMMIVQIVKGAGRHPWRVRLVASNGEILTISEGYYSKWNAKRAARRMYPGYDPVYL